MLSSTSATSLPPTSSTRAILAAGIGERALAERADDQDAIALHAGVGERDRGEIVDRDEPIGVGLGPRYGGLELADHGDHRRGVLHLIASDGERQRGVR